MTADDTDTIDLSIADDQAPSMAVITAVTALTGQDPIDCPPIADRIDTDAIDTLFADRDGGQVTFEYLDYEVTVHNDTKVSVTLPRK